VKPHNFILLVPVTIIASLVMYPNRDVFQGFILGCVAAFATYFWWITRKAEREAAERFERWQAQQRPHDPQ
jgi:hypothetical protein